MTTAPLNVPSKEQLSAIMLLLGSLRDTRQASKVQYPIRDVILLVVSAIATGAKTWIDIQLFGDAHPEELKRLLGINNIPSHDTIQRIMSIVSPSVLEKIYLLWCEGMDFAAETPESLRGHKLLNLDGKTIRGSKGKGKKGVHIETAWDPQRAVALAQMAVPEKTNEITAIPEILNMLNLAGYIVTSDAMGTQKEIARQIVIKNHADYLLAVKENQPSLCESFRDFANDVESLEVLKKEGHYKKKIEKAHGQIETREYWQTDAIDWIEGKEKWEGLQTAVFERTTLNKKGKISVSWRFFICTLPADIEMAATAVRGHWQIESMHNTLDVILKEDDNHTIERVAAENLNVIRKWVISLLRHFPTKQKLSLRSKAYHLSQTPTEALEMVRAGLL